MINHVGVEIYQFFQSMSLWGAFLNMFIENVGIPFPTEVGYLIGRDLIFQGKYSFSFVVFVLTLGNVLGSLLSYRLGVLGDNYVARKMKTNNRLIEAQKKLRLWYKKYGNLAVFIARFVGYVRPWSSFVAGFASIDFWPFLLWTTVGALIFNIGAVYFAGIIVLIWRNFEPYRFIIAVIFFLLFFGAFIYEAINLLIKKKRAGSTKNAK